MQQNTDFLAPGEDFIPYDRCQIRECPLTGIENCNHSVVPGCILYGKSINRKSSTSVLSHSSIRMSFNARGREGQSIISNSDDRKCSPKPPKMPQIRSKSLEFMSKCIPCCNCHSNGRATCAALRSTCACRRAGRQCTSCFPMSKGKCSNHQAQSLSALFSSTNQEKYSTRKSIDDDLETLESLEKGDPCIEKDETVMQGSHVENHNWVASKMLEAFGSLLLNSEGSARIDRIDKIWERTTKLTSSLYRLPGGSLGRKFVGMLAHEITLLSQAKEKSERCCMFARMILQKDCKFKKSADIRRLVKRKLQLWENDRLEELIQEAENSERKLR